MSGHFREETLNEFVDGTLEAHEALELESHLQTCPRCAGEVAGLRSVVKAAAALPGGIEPSRDLWPGVSAALGGSGGATQMKPTPDSRASAWPSWGWLAAAAALVLAVGVAVTGSPWRGAGGAAPNGASRTPAPDLREAEEQFAQATRQLFAALEAANGSASPEIRALLKEHLRLVDQAIAETIAALERDPQNAHLGRMLTEMYARKMDLLQTTVRLPGRA